MRRNEATLNLLATRRSVSAKKLAAPGPDAGELQQLLTMAARVPDHKKLVPWRFIVFTGEARAAFGRELARICALEEAETPGEARLETERGRFLRAPVVVCVVSHIHRDKPVPEWEQVLSAGAVCQNMLLGATALGYSANWITEWYAFSSHVAKGLGLADNERVAGFVYIGTAQEAPVERERPSLDDIVTHWSAQPTSAGAGATEPARGSDVL